MIHFRLNTHSGVPPYLQIVQQVRHALQVGMLQAGDKLPTVREVVAHVPINPNTVFKAYRELEREGLVSPRAGVGTIVLGRPAGPPPAEQAALAADLAAWIRRAKSVGMHDDAIEALLQAVVQRKEK
ncbi:MAG TPA: GntR family transcriptional regulator [Candidatus Saccharimonadales bacterium]|nr:GntR family transcriptional regulator [Candidatus Saccharimonadales bacterium]